MTEKLVALENVARLSTRVIRLLGQNPGKFTLQGTNTYLVLPVDPPLEKQPHPSSSALKVAPSFSSNLTFRPSILIDTGEGREKYTSLLEQVLTNTGEVSSNLYDAPESPLRQTWISDIILTHKHHDHVGGLPSVLNLLRKLRKEWQEKSSHHFFPPRLHKFPDAATDPTLIEQLRALPPGSYSPYTAFDGPTPLWPLRDGGVIRIEPDESGSCEAHVHVELGNSPPYVDALSSPSAPLPDAPAPSLPPNTTSLQVIHSPGHANDHVCLLLREEHALFSGDHVLGQGTTIFEDLGQYLGSLERCARALVQVGGSNQAHTSTSKGEGSPVSSSSPHSLSDENRIYPAHGPVLEEGRRALATYATHRLQREKELLELLARPSPSRSTAIVVPHGHNVSAGGSERIPEHLLTARAPVWRIREIVGVIYQSYPENLYPAAARGIFLHLHKLALPDNSLPSTLRSLLAPNGERARCLADEEEALEGSDTTTRDDVLPEVTAPLTDQNVPIRDIDLSRDSQTLMSGIPLTPPRMPQGESEWIAAMESRWILLPSSSSSRPSSSGPVPASSAL